MSDAQPDATDEHDVEQTGTSHARLSDAGARPLFLELSPEAWGVVEDQVEAFELAWERGERPCKQDFLVDPDPTQGQLLVELVLIEMERRLRRGETPRADEYLDQHPELMQSPAIEGALRSLEQEFASESVRETVAGSTAGQAALSAPVESDRGTRLNELGLGSPRATFAHFDLLEQLGSGGFGVVWKARDRRLDRIVAVKIPHPHRLDARSRANLLREARATACLSHPGIVAIHEVDVLRNDAYLVYEYVEGESLSTWLSWHCLSPRDAARKCLDLAQAVSHAHDRGIIHRDLTPSNILVDRKQSLLITDFGLSKRFDGPSDLSRDGVIMGSVPYMSPEQAAGSSRAADARTDVYGLGAVLFEMLTGRPPFRAEDPDVLEQILHHEPPTPRALDPLIPDALQSICLQAMAKRPDDRYPTAAALAEDLSRFLDGTDILASRRPATRVIGWLRRHLKVVATVIAVGAVLLLFAAGDFDRSDEQLESGIEPGRMQSIDLPANAKKAPHPDVRRHPAPIS